MKFKFTKSVIFAVSILLVHSAQAKHILIYGDSLSAAYGMDLEQGWVYLLAKEYEGKHEITNASISGETTHGGLQRLPVTLEQIDPDIIFIELGANDGMQGYPIARISDNLKEMVALAQENGVQVVLAGITIPATYGPRYIDEFRSMFKRIASDSGAAYIDLYDDEFVLTDGYIQDDGLHPTPITQPIIRETIARFFDDSGLLSD